MIQGIVDKRLAAPTPDKDDMDLVDVLLSIKDEHGESQFSADIITGMFISMMFAGHHTTSGTAAWTLIELLRNPEHLDGVTTELDELYADGSDVSYQALREIPYLESSIKEALRLQPPLILLLRLANEDFEVEGITIEAGKLVGASLSVSNRPARGLPRGRSRTTRRGTWTLATRTCRTRGTGSRSVPVGTAASVRTSR